jgi:hypothetical protein
MSILGVIERLRNEIDAFLQFFRRNIFLPHREMGNAGNYSGSGCKNPDKSASAPEFVFRSAVPGSFPPGCQKYSVS